MAFSLDSIWALITHYFTLCRLWYIRWVLEPSPRQDPLEHCILVVGDDNALGYGDKWKASMPGVAGYIGKVMQQESSIRQTWHVINRGHCSTTTADWAPSSGQHGAKEQKRSLVERTLEEAKAAAAEVVLVILGSEDARTTISPEQTISNLDTVCRVLAEDGRRLVYLVNIPTMSGGVGSAEATSNVLRNDMLQEYIKSAQESIRAGPRIDAEYFEFNRTDLFTPDGRHLNATGYQKLAKDWMFEARHELVKREFAVFQQLIESSKEEVE